MEPTWNKRDIFVKAINIPNPKTAVPRIVRPLKVPRHTYTQVTLILHLDDTDIVKAFHFTKLHRIYVLRRGMEYNL